jgi:hypothetical protein
MFLLSVDITQLLLDFTLQWRWLCRLPFNNIWHRVAWYKFVDVLEKQHCLILEESNFPPACISLNIPVFSSIISYCYFSCVIWSIISKNYNFFMLLLLLIILQWSKVILQMLLVPLILFDFNLIPSNRSTECFFVPMLLAGRSQWPRGLRSKSAAARLLRSWVRIPTGAWMFVCCKCCVLSGRGLCDELITRPE